MLLPMCRLETSIETHPQPLLLEGREEVPSNKRGFRGVYIVFQKAKLLQIIKQVGMKNILSGKGEVSVCCLAASG